MSNHQSCGKSRFPFVLLVLLALALPANAHETDQFTLPPGREFADLSDYFTRVFYDAMARAVEKQNSRIKTAVEKNQKKEAENLSSADDIALAVNREFPAAMFLINDFDKIALSPEAKLRYPGKLTGYRPKDFGVRKKVDVPLSPFNAWQCATIRAFGVYFGTDKIGHFTDMGMHYYRAYREARSKGADETKATAAAVKMGCYGPIYSERGILGLATAGAYSNADLVANYMGMCFYRNLTEPVMLKGVERPPLLIKDGKYWKLAEHVRVDSDFFSWFVSDHYNEALNPSMYRADLREKIRKTIVERRRDVLLRYADPNGNCWSAERFETTSRELLRYYGVDYGHEGDKELLTIPRLCFAPPPDPNKPDKPNADGLTPMHYAAWLGDVAMLERLAGAGADVNVRVQSTAGAPAASNDTPLHLAAREGRLEAVQFLLAHKADINAKNDRGATPLHTSVEYPQVLDALLKAGAQVDAIDDAGRTAMHWAALDRQAPYGVQLLLNYHATAAPLDREGATPLHDAARAGHVQAIVALIRGGADVNAPDRFGATPLHRAASRGGSEAVDLLLRSGASPALADRFGCTPLHVAAREHQPEVVQLLMNKGANPNAADIYGATALATAERINNKSVVAVMKQGPESSSAAPAAATVNPQAPAPPEAPEVSSGGESR